MFFGKHHRCRPLLACSVNPVGLGASFRRMIGCEEGRLRACSLQTGLQITVAFTALINWMGAYCLVFIA